MKHQQQPQHRRPPTPADELIAHWHENMIAGAELIATTPTGAELYRTPAGRYFRRDLDGAIHPMIETDARSAATSEEQPA